MRGALFLWALAFLVWSCGGTQRPCTIESYRAAVSAAYAPHVEECAKYETVDDCPGYWAAKREHDRLRKEYIECQP